MELAIPVLALGGLYIMSNQEQNEDRVKEGFINHGESSSYPVPSTNASNSVNAYSNPNQATDKYFDETIVEEHDREQNIQNVENVISLTGEAMDVKSFKHNNMVPFFGSRIKGPSASDSGAESILDNLQGGGSQIMSKKEVAPLFAPSANMDYVAGAPNNSDFFQSRVQPSLRAGNVKPWEEERVAPGLGLGYTKDGSHGFNAGVTEREYWQPKTVDELRVATNPKTTYTLDNLEGPLKRPVGNLGVMGKMEKYNPDTFYNSGPERWFTTTGAEKGETARGEQMLADVNRPFTTREYYGGAIEAAEGGYVPGKHTEPKRNPLPCNPLPTPGAPGQSAPGNNDFGRDGYAVLPNNRALSNEGSLGFVGGAIKAALAPLMDVLRPSRKEDVVGNICSTGYVAPTNVAAPMVNPADRAQTTIREMTGGLLDNNHLNVENQSGAAYTVSEHHLLPNQRDSTSVYYTGPSNENSGHASYMAAHNQRNNSNKTQINRPNKGGTAMMMSSQHLSIARKDSDRTNNRDPVKAGGHSAIPNVANYGVLSGGNVNEAHSDNERINPDMLNAFKSNPFAQPLNAWA